MKIGFIGLGSIGKPMAFNLVRSGYVVTVHDIEQARAKDLLALGACWADSPRNTALASHVLFTSLPGPPQIASVIEGEDGAIHGLAPGSIWVDLSTSDLVLTRRLANELAARGIQTLDAPVTGGVENARIAQITLFAGGDPEVFERVRPLFSAIASNVLYIGPLGTATVVKLITNFMCMVHVVAMGEGLVLGATLGIDTIKIWEAIKVSYADSFVARVDGPSIFSGDYGQSFSIALACKDLQLSLKLAREAGLQLEATELAGRLYASACEKYGDEAGALSVVRQLEDQSHVSLPRGPARETLNNV
jgi:3-hydroxyisobutyrate dehydrogenase